VVKRFYKTVGVEEAADGFLIRLDARELRTPAKAVLRLPTQALAEALAAEWAEQGEDLKPTTMSLMQIVSTAVDIVPARREIIRRELVGYAGTDLLCYRAETPLELAALEAAAWDPLLDWLLARYDAALQVTAGIVPITQSPNAIEALARVVAALDDAHLAILQIVVGQTGSLVLGLALLEGRIDAADAARLARLDEAYQNARWGEDWETTERAERVARDIANARRALDLLDA
jgi:chaperone required for assembly of F1-ATPase